MLPWTQADKVTVAVVGDLILDEYLEGSVKRISPEAPVPVFHVHGTSWRAGGAANAALNVQNLGAQAIIYSVTGMDDSSATLFDILAASGVDTSGVFRSSHTSTVRKQRVTAGHQQMMRIDWEKNDPIDPNFAQKIIANMQSMEFDAILVSDYGKGLLSADFLKEIFAIARSREIPCIVDPKGKDFSRYRGASLITPNRSEGLNALETEDTDLKGEEIARRLREKFQLADIAVTLGADGIVFSSTKCKSPVYAPAEVYKEVFDVSGAGDTVAAILTLAAAVNAPPEVALRLANVGAGTVVAKWGTQPVQLAELQNALISSRNKDRKHTKILAHEELIEFVQAQQEQGMRVVFTNGCFDILHVGHVTYLTKAKELGDVLVVAVNTDESVQKLKGPNRPVNSLADRMTILAGLAAVDHVVSFGESTPAKLIEALKPNVLVKGSDYKISEIVGAESVLSNGGSVETIDLVPEASTTSIIEKISRP